MPQLPRLVYSKGATATVSYTHLDVYKRQGLGTSIGGYRIIKSVGMDMVKLKPYQGFRCV